MRFPVLVQIGIALCPKLINQPMIQKLEETWCVKITSFRAFLDIAGLSLPRSNFYIHCHLKIRGLKNCNFDSETFRLPICLWS